VDGDGGGAFFGEGAGLVHKFFGEVEGDEVVIAEFPESEGNAAGAAAGFEETGGLVGKKTLDEEFFGFPESEAVRGAGVVDDRDGVVEVVADGRGGDFFRRVNHGDTEAQRPEGQAGSDSVPLCLCG